jgi:sec-independent protein translocase protein TatA
VDHVGLENPVHLLVVAVVALLVLGPKRLPEVGRAIGQGLREFKQSVAGTLETDETDEDDESEPADPDD